MGVSRSFPEVVLFSPFHTSGEPETSETSEEIPETSKESAKVATHRYLQPKYSTNWAVVFRWLNYPSAAQSSGQW